MTDDPDHGEAEGDAAQGSKSETPRSPEDGVDVRFMGQYVSPGGRLYERYESGEPETDVWISDSEFQCDVCSLVFPDWLAARTPNGTFVCESCLDLMMNDGLEFHIGKPQVADSDEPQ
jgi:hypothetical protein